MLYIVLALVVAALGLLIAALTTANTIWAWISVTISVVAAVLLIADWLGARRRRAATPAVVAKKRPPAPPAELHEQIVEPVREPIREPAREPVEEPFVQRSLEPEPVTELSEPAVAGPESLVEQTIQQAPVVVPTVDEEPAEEPTDAADLLVVSELTAEVRVVDEHPRYHLASCGWLGDRPTLPLPVNEARQLGFTPCAYCGPDAVLAARHRAAR